MNEDTLQKYRVALHIHEHCLSLSCDLIWLIALPQMKHTHTQKKKPLAGLTFFSLYVLQDPSPDGHLVSITFSVNLSANFQKK